MSLSRPRKQRLRFVLCSLVLPLAFALSLAQAQAPAQPAAAGGGNWKALEVLPKDIAKPQLKAIMKAQAKALNVECDYCHKEPSMEAETPKKKIAREMMRMTDELNKKYRATTNGKVTCWSCHRGENRPVEVPGK